MRPTFATSRLGLREINAEDGPELQAYQQLPSNWQLQAVDECEYADGARIERDLAFRGSGETRRLHTFVARDKAHGHLIGEVGISRTFPRTAAIFFSVTPDKWGMGYASELARFALSFGIEQLHVHRVTASVAVENPASCRVLEKAGMVREGTSRECIEARGRWWTEHQYAMIASDRRA
ncbi:MAG: GNAT family protein [Pseudomonadota bacterium]